MELRYETLPPSEAAGATGVSNAHQISGRKSGLFQSTGQGHAKWDLKGLSRLAVFKPLSARGLGPKVVAPFLGEAEDAVWRHALLLPGVYDPAAIRAAELVWDQYIDKNYHNPDPERRGVLLRRHALQHLYAQVTGEMEDYSTSSLPAGVPPLIVSWPDDTVTQEDWERLETSWRNAPENRRGAILILTVAEIAEQLVARLPRPLIFLNEDEGAA